MCPCMHSIYACLHNMHVCHCVCIYIHRQYNHAVFSHTLYYKHLLTRVCKQPNEGGNHSKHPISKVYSTSKKVESD